MKSAGIIGEIIAFVYSEAGIRIKNARITTLPRLFVPPNQADHASCLLISAIRKKAFFIRIGAKSAARNIGNTESVQSLCSDLVKISQKSTACCRIRHKSLSGLRVERTKLLNHFPSDLECMLSDSRSEPCTDFRRRTGKFRHRTFQHAVA